MDRMNFGRNTPKDEIMDIETARKNIGELVFSKDRKSNKLNPENDEHGPYRLIAVTKSGHAILEGLEDYRSKPSLIRLKEDVK
jgi:hypothetical protein